MPVGPRVLSGMGLIVGVLAAGAATQKWWIVALIAFASNRLLDGLDGVVARSRGLVSASGAYLDMVADTMVYILVPLGIAIGHDRSAVWAAAAALLGSFAVNLISWSYLSALLEERGRGRSSTGELTSVTMPRGMVEGAETIGWFALFLLMPQWIVGLMLSMAIAVAIGALVRVRQGVRLLDRTDTAPVTSTGAATTPSAAIACVPKSVLHDA